MGSAYQYHKQHSYPKKVINLPFTGKVEKGLIFMGFCLFVDLYRGKFVEDGTRDIMILENYTKAMRGIKGVTNGRAFSASTLQ